MDRGVLFKNTESQDIEMTTPSDSEQSVEEEPRPKAKLPKPSNPAAPAKSKKKKPVETGEELSVRATPTKSTRKKSPRSDSKAHPEKTKTGHQARKTHSTKPKDQRQTFRDQSFLEIQKELNAWGRDAEKGHVWSSGVAIA